MNLAFGNASWEFWEDYDPSNHVYGNQKVTFDGLRKWIRVNEGVTSLDVGVDIYSNYKEWMGVRPYDDVPNMKWRLGLTADGGAQFSERQEGDELVQEFLDVTVFLENGWRIKPWQSSVGYSLDIIGNIFTREAGQNPVVPESNVTVTFTRSSISKSTVITNTPVIDDIAISPATKEDIAARVWTQATAGSTSGTYGRMVNELDSDMTTVVTEVDDTLKKTEFLALQ